MTQTRVPTRKPARPRSAAPDLSAPDPGPETTADGSAESRHTLIAVAAYRRAEARGFAPGSELDDWLTAEIEVDARMRAALKSGDH